MRHILLVAVFVFHANRWPVTCQKERARAQEVTSTFS